MDVPRGKTYCFVHYRSADAAARAMRALEGAVLPQLSGGGRAGAGSRGLVSCHLGAAGIDDLDLSQASSLIARQSVLFRGAGAKPLLLKYSHGRSGN